MDGGGTSEVESAVKELGALEGGLRGRPGG